MALWVALIVTVGLVFAFIPNIELVIFVAYLGGAALGAKRGFIVVVMGETIFSAFNPLGSGLAFPILLLLQIISIGFAGLMGGWTASIVLSIRSRIFRLVCVGLTGFFLTLVYDILTSLSLPLSTGMTEGTLIGSITAGLAFFVMHMVSNTILFSLFAPASLILVQNQMQMHGLDSR